MNKLIIGDRVIIVTAEYGEDQEGLVGDIVDIDNDEYFNIKVRFSKEEDDYDFYNSADMEKVHPCDCALCDEDEDDEVTPLPLFFESMSFGYDFTADTGSMNIKTNARGLNGDALSLNRVAEDFAQFLRSCGYGVEGITITNELGTEFKG